MEAEARKERRVGAGVDTVYHGRREGASTGKAEGLSPHKSGTDSRGKGKELNRRCQRVPQVIFCSPQPGSAALETKS